MEPMKISFGFNKINKKPIIISNKIAQKSENNKVELIKCLEGQEIKLVEEKPEEAPLVIPLKESQKTSAALASLMKRRAVLLGEDEPMESPSPADNAEIIVNETEDIEKRAAKELLAELNANSTEKHTSDLVLPVVHPDDLPLEGAKESSLDDYDDIPIEQFGKAMLRGMGWTEPPKPAKGVLPLDDSPMVRPKGMGLGADKALKAKPLLVAPESNEVLQIKRNAFVRILGGKHKDMYGQIEGFDDHAGRVIVKMAIGGFKEAFNEFLCQPISKKEYAQYGKCINSTKYDEYKRKENEHGQIILKKEEIAEITKKSIKYEKIKREKVHELSSDDDCEIVERKPLKAEFSSGSREKTYYDERNAKEERNYKKEYKREDEYERTGASYKDERSIKKENTRDGYDGDRKRDDYAKDGKHRDGQRYKERGDEDNKEKSRDQQKDSYGRNRERNRERSRDRYESKYCNEDVERRRDATKDNSRDRHRDYRDKDYDERKSRQIKADQSDKVERNKHKKSSKDKKTKKKSKKSKKSKSKYRDSSESESSSSSSNTSDSEEDERHKKHKKKKSKEERGRSRSRGRR